MMRAQVGMPVEADAEQIENFALEEVRCRPDRGQRIQRRASSPDSRTFSRTRFFVTWKAGDR